MKAVTRLCLTLLSLIALLFPKTTKADENQFVTVVNPVRISKYTKDPLESIQSQYKIVSDNDISATWLLTFDVLNNDETSEFFVGIDNDQEVGIYFEVTPGFASEAGIEYRNTGFWHHATSLFLSGYTQEERIKLIDTLFNKYKELFSLYPKSVGAWWIDSYSLSYMQEKYGVIANLGLADQFSTDNYQVWGTYWSTPFYPSKYHAGLPAARESVKIDVVTIQWAPRDPYNGYKDSFYSTQDYEATRVNLSINFFEKLVSLYGFANTNDFGQITVGLEGDLNPESYEEVFKEQIEFVSSLIAEEKIKTVTMSEFATWYKNTFPKLSPTHLVESVDLSGEENIKVIWYSTPYLRVGILHDYSSGVTKIFDLRTYHENFQEPYYSFPNREFDLSIYIPSYFDEVNNPDDVWRMNLGKLTEVKKENDEVLLGFDDGNKITLGEKRILIEKEGLELPEVLVQSKALDIRSNPERTEITPKDKWIAPREGIVVTDLTPEATHFISTKKMILGAVLGLGLFFTASIFVIFSKLSDRLKLVTLTFIIFPLLIFVSSWYRKNVTNYYVSQGEIDALYRLSLLPPGKVVVYDNECLLCEYQTKLKPAVFANKREYVKTYGKQSIIYNKSTFEAENQEEARREFEKLNVDYIYLAKYGDHIEKTPFSPGDLGIEKIYDNANAEIWRVIKRLGS